MKHIRLIPLLLILLVSAGVNSQCWLESLVSDLNNSEVSTGFKQFIKNNPNAADSYKIIHNYDQTLQTDVDLLSKLSTDLDANTNLLSFFNQSSSSIDAWQRIRTAIDNTANNGFTYFAIDILTIQKVGDMLSEGSIFRQKFQDNYMQVIDEILKAAKNSPCVECPPPTGLTNAFPSMEKHLENINYFIENFEVNGKADKFFYWMRGKKKEGGDLLPNSTLKSEMAQTLDELKKRGFKEADVEISKSFHSGSTTSKMSDITYGDLDIELKNKDFANASTANGKLSEQEIEQVLGAEGAFSVKTNVSNYEWKVNPLRNNADLTNLKELWKKAFIEKADDIFKSVDEGGLGITKIRQLFGNNINNLSDFIDLAENIENSIYNFIKSE